MSNRTRDLKVGIMSASVEIRPPGCPQTITCPVCSGTLFYANRGYSCKCGYGFAVCEERVVNGGSEWLPIWRQSAQRGQAPAPIPNKEEMRRRCAVIQAFAQERARLCIERLRFHRIHWHWPDGTPKHLPIIYKCHAPM